MTAPCCADQACREGRRAAAELHTLSRHLVACVAQSTKRGARHRMSTPAADTALVTITLAAPEAALLWACADAVLRARGALAEICEP